MIAHLDMFSGVSGDMLLGALVDAGLEPPRLREALRGLRVPAFDLEVRRVRRGAIEATHARWRFADEAEHRHLPEIERLIERARLPDAVTARALTAFRRLAEAEGRVHGVPPERVHFHEVGALDAVLDVCGVTAGLHLLGVARVEASAFRTGRGWIDAAHGRLPVPAPAVAYLLEGWRVEEGGEGELTTPTGAALVTTLATPPGGGPRLVLRRVGYGAGTRDLDDRPNVLRLLLGDALDEEAGAAADGWRREEMVLLETSIDDLNPQLYGVLEERLVSAGAREVALVPAGMKKGRPGTIVRCLADPERVDALARVLFRETTTLGVRAWPVRRLALERREGVARTSLGEVRVKRVRGPGTRRETRVEYDEARRLAREHGLPVREVLDRLQRELSEEPSGEGSVAAGEGSA